MPGIDEVKIVVRQESQGNALDKTRQQIDGVADAGKRAKGALDGVGDGKPAGAAPRKTKQPYFTAQDLARAEAGMADNGKGAALTRNRRAVARTELALERAKAGGDTGDIERLDAKLRSLKLTGRFIREQDLNEGQASAKAGQLVHAQDAARKVAAEERAGAKEKAKLEKDSTREMLQQESTQRRITTRLIPLGRDLLTGGSLSGGLASLARAGGTFLGPAAALLAGGEVVQAMTKDYMERQGIANRNRASRASDERDLGIRGGWRGTSSQAQAAQFGTEQEIFDREQQRAEILRRNQRAWYNPLGWAGKLAWWGKDQEQQAAAQEQMPWFNPRKWLGTTSWAGLRERDENEQNIQRLRARRAAEEAQGHNKFENEEGGLQLDALRQRAKRTLGGQRGAQVDEETQKWLSEYRRFKSMHASDDEANEAGKLTVQNELRNRQAASAAGLVDARAGAADIAAAAHWAQMTTPNWGDIGSKIDAMHATLKGNGDKSHEARTREAWQ